MLCGLGSASFATTATRRGEILPVLSMAVVITAFFPATALPDARWIGFIAAAAAAIRIFRPDARGIGALLGGMLAGVLGALLRSQEVPPAVCILLAAAVPSVSAYLSKSHPRFAPEKLHEEAMLATMALGLAVAVIPEIASGWQSALALNREEGPGSNQIIANWVFVLSAASVALGGLYSLLRRR